MTPFGWLYSVLTFDDQEIIHACGLDAYFFLRYLRTLLKIFTPLSVIILPVLVPLNYVGGKGTGVTNTTGVANVTGMDQYAWDNIRLAHTDRYWAHLTLAVLVVVYVCGVFFIEFRHFVHKRQEYLTSEGHRAKPSASSVLLSAIPNEAFARTAQQPEEALSRLFSDFPGGVRQVWINRRVDALARKIGERDDIHARLEAAETRLIQKAVRAHGKAEQAAREGASTHDAGRTLRNTASASRESGAGGGAAQGKADPRPSPRRESNGAGLWRSLENSFTLPALTVIDTPSARVDLKGEGRHRGDVGASLSVVILRRAKGLMSACLAADYADDEDGTDAVWKRYLDKRDRPTHRVPIFRWTPRWLPGLPLLNRKVDTIYWCRRQLSRLNSEIKAAQERPQQFPRLNSAFVQFNNQLSAHRACQTVIPHLPALVTRRTAGVSPRDIIWRNMSVPWWLSWLRLAVVMVAMAAFVILWALPVIWTAYLSQMTLLVSKYGWLYWLNDVPQDVLHAISGVLPAAVLSVLFAVVPQTLDYLAVLTGAQTEIQRQKYVQWFYFAFLFIQVFLIVSISRGAFAALATATNITAIPKILATQLPKAANYFFSYMILQAMSASSGTLLQPLSLLSWFVDSWLGDGTARQRWLRDTTLSTISWGSVFPVYTNFACIALVYSVVSPLVMVFAIITFFLLWVTNRYNVLYVMQSKKDTGGLVYPTAINQTFTGLYIMELCLIGLFFLVEDETGRPACIPHAVIMIATLFLTAPYQILLNVGFSPLINHAATIPHDECYHYTDALSTKMHKARCKKQGSLASESSGSGLSHFSNESTSAEADRVGNNTGLELTCGDLDEIVLHDNTRHSPPKEPKARDAAPAAHCCQDAYFMAGQAPAVRLQEDTFQHHALKTRCRPVWIPKDGLGISDFEVEAMKSYANEEGISATNGGAMLDGRLRVVYNLDPPDLLEWDGPSTS